MATEADGAGAQADVGTEVVLAPLVTVQRAIDCTVYCRFTMAANSAPTDPAVVKSLVLSKSCHIAVTTPVGVASSGLLIDHPVVTPDARVFVAVNVAPPVPVTLLSMPHLIVFAPLATEKTQVFWVDESKAIGLAAVPVRESALVRVIVPAPGQSMAFPDPIDKVLISVGALVQLHTAPLVDALNVQLLYVSAPQAITYPTLAPAGVNTVILQELIVKVKDVTVAKFQIVVFELRLPPIVMLEPSKKLRVEAPVPLITIEVSEKPFIS